MTTTLETAARKPESDLDLAVSELQQGAQWLQSASVAQRRELVEACILQLGDSANDWVDVACRAKRIPPDQPLAAEEILAGPGTLLRYLDLLVQVFRDIEQSGQPKLPAKPYRNLIGRQCVPILPVRSMYDGLIFMGLKAEVWLDPSADDQALFRAAGRIEGNAEPTVAGVLGAGNVSSIPATDMLFKVFHDGQSVLLKLNPVNDYLAPIFETTFQPLINADLLRIIKGDGEVGRSMVHHPGIQSLHITGSHLTHDAIVWGKDPNERAQRKSDQNPLLAKNITSELGNVTPWIIVPGNYSQRQLQAQAQHVAASIANNASFNCLATKMMITSSAWSQRDQFLELVEARLKELPPRYAYYPGARERFETAIGTAAPNAGDETLPWTLIRDADPAESARLFEDESFVCVCAETALGESDPRAFLESAVEFANERLFGTLCATMTVTDAFQKQFERELNQAIENLRYGSVCINQWSGVVYGMMTPPWGGHPSSTLESTESGIGHVHNTFFLNNVEKAVLWGPLVNFPKPVWFPSHRNAHRVAWSLFRLYQRPSWLRLPKLLFHAMRG